MSFVTFSCLPFGCFSGTSAASNPLCVCSRGCDTFWSAAWWWKEVQSNRFSDWMERTVNTLIKDGGSGNALTEAALWVTTPLWCCWSYLSFGSIRSIFVFLPAIPSCVPVFTPSLLLTFRRITPLERAGVAVLNSHRSHTLQPPPLHTQRHTSSSLPSGWEVAMTMVVMMLM